MILVERCAQFPGLAIDGSQPKPGEYVVDTEIELYGQHRLYITRSMAREICELYRWPTREAHDALRVDRDAWKARAETAESRLAEIEPIIAAVTSTAATLAEEATV